MGFAKSARKEEPRNDVYVSADLDVFEDVPDIVRKFDAEEFTFEGKAYAKLNKQYAAWLSRKHGDPAIIPLAKKARIGAYPSSPPARFRPPEPINTEGFMELCFGPAKKKEQFDNTGTSPCRYCKGREFWSNSGRPPWVCSRCHPCPYKALHNKKL